MLRSKDSRTKEHTTRTTLVFLAFLAVVFAVVIGVLPYMNLSLQATKAVGTSTAPVNPAAHYQSGIRAYMAGNYKAAIDEFTQAIDQKYVPLERADLGRGQAYYSYGVDTHDEAMLDKAISDFEAAHDLNPQYLEVFSALGWAYYQKASFYKKEEQAPYLEQASDIFRQGLELNKKLGQTDIQIFDGLGWTDYSLGQYQDAVDYFKEALNYNPDLEDAQEGLNLAEAGLQK